MNETKKSKCIYCCELIENSQRSKEHVISKTFTKNFKNNLTIQNVCKQCNSALNSKIDNKIAENGFLADLRQNSGKQVKVAVFTEADKVKVTNQAELDEKLIENYEQRVFVKLAFNYLSYCTKALKNRSPIYLECFNKAREFITNGNNPGYGIINIKVDDQPKNIDDFSHFITLRVPDSSCKDNLFGALVSYYGVFFEITLSTNYQGQREIQNLCYGHKWNYDSKETKKLTAKEHMTIFNNYFRFLIE